MCKDEHAHICVCTGVCRVLELHKDIVVPVCACTLGVKGRGYTCVSNVWTVEAKRLQCCSL